MNTEDTKTERINCSRGYFADRENPNTAAVIKEYLGENTNGSARPVVRHFSEAGGTLLIQNFATDTDKVFSPDFGNPVKLSG